jgi:hypothetical protein
MAQSQRGPDIETEASRQAYFIKWTEISGIPNPCSLFQGYQRIMAIYIKYVQCGVNYNNKQALHSAAVQGYAKAINTLFKLQNFAPPDNFLDPNNMTAILVNNLLKEEDIVRQHSPLNNSIFAELRRVSDASRDEDQVQNLLFNVVALGRYIGPCLS